MAACEPDFDGESPPVPLEDEWVEVYDAPFVADLNDPEHPDVLAFTVGSTGISDNFMNRGDVEVFYTLPPLDEQGIGRIVVQMQRFTGAEQDDAEEQFAAIEPWIARGSLRPLGEVSAEDRCDDVFTDGCNIAVYYEGLTQPARAGANLRVFLPRNYRGEIDVVTQDNIWPEGTYLERSNVRMVGLYGEATVQLESGRAEVVLAQDILPAPRCGDTDALAIEANAACAAYVNPVTDEAAPWDKRCGCQADLGKLKVYSVSPEAAIITVDVPATAWTAISVNNRGDMQSASDHCSADIYCEDFEACEIDERLCHAETPWTCAAMTNVPGPDVVKGIGYAVSLLSDECSEVSFHEGPARYGAAPDIERRGAIEVCSGCLDASTPAPPD